MPCRTTQDGRVMVESSDKMWSTGEGNGKPLQYSCLENPMNSMKGSSQISMFLRLSYSQIIALCIFTMWFLEGSKIILHSIGMGVYLSSSPYLKSPHHTHTHTHTHTILLGHTHIHTILLGLPSFWERDRNTRPPDLPLETPICRSGSKLELDKEQQTGPK